MEPEAGAGPGLEQSTGLMKLDLRYFHNAPGLNRHHFWTGFMAQFGAD
jgi:hypothetical protein